MPINSRAKGKVGELELVKFLISHGFAARRGVQHKGGPDSPDVICPDLPGVHLECKRVEVGNLYKWYHQACGDAAVGEVPVVAHRRNREPWVAVIGLWDLLDLYRKAYGRDGQDIGPGAAGNAPRAEAA